MIADGGPIDLDSPRRDPDVAEIESELRLRTGIEWKIESAPWLAEFRQLGHSRNSVRKGRRALAPVGSTSDAPARGSPLHRAAEVRQAQGRGYNESELGGFVDHEDEAVYAEAVRIFRRNVHRYLLGFQV